MSATICEKDDQVAIAKALGVIKTLLLSLTEDVGALASLLREAEEWLEMEHVQFELRKDPLFAQLKEMEFSAELAHENTRKIIEKLWLVKGGAQ